MLPATLAHDIEKNPRASFFWRSSEKDYCRPVAFITTWGYSGPLWTTCEIPCRRHRVHAGHHMHRVDHGVRPGHLIPAWFFGFVFNFGSRGQLLICSQKDGSKRRTAEQLICGRRRRLVRRLRLRWRGRGQAAARFKQLEVYRREQGRSRNPQGAHLVAKPPGRHRDVPKPPLVAVRGRQCAAPQHLRA